MLNERDHLRDPGVDGRITKTEFQEVGNGAMDWIELAHDRDRWWEL
jgi:hypothetical protein